MGKLIDLTGQKFGMLTVIHPVEHYTPTGNKITYWHCECDCGNTCDTTSVSLRSGTKTSCGCTGRKFRGIDLTGEKHGSMTVLGLNIEERKLKKYSKWDCKCDCGNIFTDTGTRIKNNKVTCCPECFKKENDITGQKFGKLTAIKKIGNSWECICDCGNHCMRTKSALQTGKTTSCGCDFSEKVKSGKQDKGKKYGKLTVIDIDKERSLPGRKYLICVCDCGMNVSVRKDSLESGDIVSCGCYHREIVKNMHNFKQNYVIVFDNYMAIKSSNNDIDFLIDKEDYPKLKEFCWYENQGYAYAYSRNKYSIKDISMARLIMNCIENKDVEVDHINHNTYDNRKQNLRIVSTLQNNWNQERAHHACIKENMQAKTWDVSITYKLNNIKLGSYKSKELALDIRDKAEKVFYGEYKYDKEKVVDAS